MDSYIIYYRNNIILSYCPPRYYLLSEFTIWCFLCSWAEYTSCHPNIQWLWWSSSWWLASTTLHGMYVIFLYSSLLAFHLSNDLSSVCDLVFSSVILFCPARVSPVHLISGGETGPHAVPVENWGTWAEGEGVWDETLERGSGHKHAPGACCPPLSGLQKEGWSKEICPGCIRIHAAQIKKDTEISILSV